MEQHFTHIEKKQSKMSFNGGCPSLITWRSLLAAETGQFAILTTYMPLFQHWKYADPTPMATEVPKAGEMNEGH